MISGNQSTSAPAGGYLGDHVAKLLRHRGEDLAAAMTEAAAPLSRRPTHPGDVLGSEILPAVGATISETARALGITSKTLGQILACRAPVTPLTAAKLERRFGIPGLVWLRLQAAWDLWEIQQGCAADLRKVERHRLAGARA